MPWQLPVLCRCTEPEKPQKEEQFAHHLLLCLSLFRAPAQAFKTHCVLRAILDMICSEAQCHSGTAPLYSYMQTMLGTVRAIIAWSTSHRHKDFI